MKITFNDASELIVQSASIRAYFVKTRLYKRWKDNVDTILKTDGYDEVIVEN